MFTGIVEEIGTVVSTTVVSAEDTGGDLRVVIDAQTVLADVQLGDSISVSGCCLTVVAITETAFAVELSKETVTKTAPRWRVGARVNLERAMQATSRFGGHIVSGHVEGVGEVLQVRNEPGAYVVTVRAPKAMGRFFIAKGSVTVDGVSLTLVDVGGPGGSAPELGSADFTLWLIPHTLSVTTLGELKAGSRVNLEADLIAKYVERLTLSRETTAHKQSAREQTAHEQTEREAHVAAR